MDPAKCHETYYPAHYSIVEHDTECWREGGDLDCGMEKRDL